MRLRTLTGRYAGEIREYDAPVGLSALRAGTAERVDIKPPLAEPHIPAAVKVDYRRQKSYRR